MDKMLYVAMTGASQNTLAQRAHANTAKFRGFVQHWQCKCAVQ